jgi:hypothetical protein
MLLLSCLCLAGVAWLRCLMGWTLPEPWRERKDFRNSLEHFLLRPAQPGQRVRDRQPGSRFPDRRSLGASTPAGAGDPRRSGDQLLTPTFSSLPPALDVIAFGLYATT